MSIALGCRYCIHLLGRDKKRKATVCQAFPKGIPLPILRGDFNHRNEWKGDKGIRFKSIK